MIQTYQNIHGWYTRNNLLVLLPEKKSVHGDSSSRKKNGMIENNSAVLNNTGEGRTPHRTHDTRFQHKIRAGLFLFFVEFPLS